MKKKLFLAAFLYAFLLLHIFIGIPVIFLEMAWGQYGNQSPAQAFKLVPAMQGTLIIIVFSFYVDKTILSNYSFTLITYL